MPLLFTKENDAFRIGIWKIEEENDFFLHKLSLTETDKEELACINANVKKSQWMASRYLLKQLLHTNNTIHLRKDAYGKPFMESSLQFSISHCKNYAAVILSKKNCGIDIETFDPRIERIATKFLYEHEIQNAVSKDDYIKKLTIYWSAKEALYKLYGKKGLTFKTQLIVEDFEPEASGKLEAFIRTEENIQHYDINYEEVDGIVLTYVLSSFKDNGS